MGDSGQLVHLRIVAANRPQLTRGAGVPRSFPVEGSHRAPAARLPASAQVLPPYLCRERKPLSIYQGHFGAKNETGNKNFFRKFSAWFPGRDQSQFAPPGSSHLQPGRSLQWTGPADSGRRCAAPGPGADG